MSFVIVIVRRISGSSDIPLDFSLAISAGHSLDTARLPYLCDFTLDGNAT